MSRFRILLAASIVLGFAATSFPARADDPPIRLPERNWKVQSMYRGAVFSCISTECGGKDNAGIIALSENFFYIDEKEVNQSWFNPRAFVFERVRWMENFYGFNYVEFGRITKASTKDYASISMVGKANYQGKSYPIGGLWLFQGNHQTVLFSMSPSASITQRNLAAALKSGDFRRKP